MNEQIFNLPIPFSRWLSCDNLRRILATVAASIAWTPTKHLVILRTQLEHDFLGSRQWRSSTLVIRDVTIVLKLQFFNVLKDCAVVEILLTVGDGGVSSERLCR